MPGLHVTDGWQTISVSHAEETIEAILGNPAMIEAFRAGIPGNGKPFPDGAKMAKIHLECSKERGRPRSDYHSGHSA